MPYKEIDNQILIRVKNIINDNDDILVELYNKKSVQDYYLINSSAMLNRMFEGTIKGDYVTIYKQKMLPLRGFMSYDYGIKAQDLYLDFCEKYYAFFKFTYYPEILEPYGAGESLDELKIDINELIQDYGKNNLKLCFGEDPRPINSKIHLEEDDDVIVIEGGQSSNREKDEDIL